MKTKYLLGIFIISILTVCFASCSDDEAYTPIKLSYDPNSDQALETISLTPFSPTTIFINGGDGTYSIKNSDENVILVTKQTDNVLIISPVNLGSASITIKDNSDNSCSLYINVRYSTSTYVVVKHDVVIEGDNITVGDKKLLEAEILSAIPVAIKGRYIFTYTNKFVDEGFVEIYSSDTKSENGTFKREQKQTEAGVKYAKTTMQIGNKTLVYDHAPYNGSIKSNSRTEMRYPSAFIEDVTTIYKQKYPAIEKAYALQVLLY